MRAICSSCNLMKFSLTQIPSGSCFSSYRRISPGTVARIARPKTSVQSNAPARGELPRSLIAWRKVKFESTFFTPLPPSSNRRDDLENPNLLAATLPWHTSRSSLIFSGNISRSMRLCKSWAAANPPQPSPSPLPSRTPE